MVMDVNGDGCAGVKALYRDSAHCKYAPDASKFRGKTQMPITRFILMTCFIINFFFLLARIANVQEDIHSLLRLPGLLVGFGSSDPVSHHIEFLLLPITFLPRCLLRYRALRFVRLTEWGALHGSCGLPSEDTQPARQVFDSLVTPEQPELLLTANECEPPLTTLENMSFLSLQPDELIKNLRCSCNCTETETDSKTWKLGTRSSAEILCAGTVHSSGCAFEM